MTSRNSALALAAMAAYCSTCQVVSGQYVVQSLDPCGPGLPHRITALELLEDGSCLVASEADSAGWTPEIAVFKMDSAHNVVWARRSADLPRVDAIADCGHGESCILTYRDLIRLDSTGEVVWALDFSGVDWYAPPSRDLIVDSNGDIVIAFNQGGELVVSRIQADGELRWSKRIIGDFVYTSNPCCALGLSGSDSTGHSIFIGYVDTPNAPSPFFAMALRMEPDGSVPWKCKYSPQGAGNIWPSAIEVLDEDHLVLGGSAWGSSFYLPINANDGVQGGMRLIRYGEGVNAGTSHVSLLPGVGYVSKTQESPVSLYAHTIAVHDMEGNVISSGTPYIWNNAQSLPDASPLGLSTSGALASIVRDSSNDGLIFANILDSAGAWLCGAGYEPVFDSSMVVIRQTWVPDVLPGIEPIPITPVLVSTTVETTLLCQGVSVKEPEFPNSEVVITPQPVEGLFHVHLAGRVTAPIVVDIFDPLGQLEGVRKGFIHEGVFEMDGQTLLPGIHILQIQVNGRRWIGRLVKK